MKSWTWLLLALAPSLLWPQDSDTTVLKNSDRKFTILSQIEDPAEVSAFLSMLRVKEAEERHKAAQVFIGSYRKSWLLAQAYDVSARTAIEMGRYEQALEDGRFSLRLLPENPSLLILMANMEAQKNQFKLAEENASDALEYLNQIERPPNMTQNEWDALRPELTSSAYFARARAKASRGIASADRAGLLNALTDLNTAAAWNSGDPEVFYLRAIVEIQLQQKGAAAADLAFVYKTSSTLGEKAKKILSIFAKEASAPFDVFVENLPERAIDLKARQGKEKEDTQALRYGYAGPGACQSCHTNEYSAWRKTGMSKMLQPYRQDRVLGDFSNGAKYVENTSTIRMGSTGRPYFEFSNLGSWVRYYVDFTIGSKWQQAYATKLPDGRLQVLPIEYNLLQKKWINYWEMIDPPGGSRANIQDFPKLTAATNYQQNCAICHTSQLKVDTASAGSMEHAAFLEPGIDCEMCHGPSAWHIKQIKKGVLEHLNPAEPPLDFRQVSNRDGVRVCAQCHRQSAVREIGEGGEMNYSTKGTFVPATWLRPYDAFSRKAFYKDGHFRETTFIVEAFTRSACYLRGTAQCATCHSPHLGDFETNKTSLKFVGKPNEMCLSCHSSFRNREAEHSRHGSAGEASQCITCHMPRTMNALLFKARSHQIEVPSVDLTERFGQQDSPNICLTCHSEKGAAWVKEQLATWPH